MASLEKQQSTGPGKLVSLEGDVETISTQLRLLPPSQKILVLPSLLENISTTDKHSFKPRAYIREVHEAYTGRIETARSFLETSTAWHPKLVLMNGGSVGARTTCIANICQNLTNGDVEKAEAIFDDIVKDGVAGLLAHEDEGPEYAESNDGNETVERADEREEDPTVKAMKAADSLDRETAALLEDSVGDDSEITIVTPEEGSDEAQVEATSEDPEREIRRATEAVYKDDIRTTEITVPDRKGALTDGLSTFGGAGSHTSFSAGTPLATPNSHASMHDDEDYDTDLLSPGAETFSVPPTPRVEYGEACIINVQATTLTNNLSKEVRRSRSMEELSRGVSKPQIISFPPGNLRHSKSEYHLGERPTTAGGRMEDPNALVQLPRKAFVRASPTTIRRSQSLLFLEPPSSQTSPTLRIFIDRGADACASEVHAKADSEEHLPYEPVFPALEDIVIHWVNDAPNEILASVFQSYKNGTCPTMPTPDSTVSDDECPRTPTNAAESISDETSESEVETSIEDEFDPYSSDNQYPIIKHNIPRSKFSLIARQPSPEPPSPTITLRAPSAMVHEKFCEFSTLAPSTVIGTQNSLRAFLGARFPAGEMGYTQYYFSAAPEADRLWKPVFRNDQNASIGDEGRTVDQIIALGCEDGVKKEFFNQISGQVERLGTKRDGLSRSGKLDLRYLISSALQTFAALPLAARSIGNLPNSSTLLATLLVPHIETYLATNPSVRLLILLYPSSHLPTVIALRKLLGQDVLKIAGVVDTLSSDPRPRTPITHPLSNDSTSPTIHKRRGSRKSIGSQASQNSFHQAKKSELSFSKANYLLPSTATDAEITAFLSGIWKSLVEKSAFYTPEPELEPIVVEKIVEKFIDRKPLPPPKSKISRLTGTNEKRSHSYAPSIASTVRSMATVRTMGTMRTTATERGRREVDKAWEDFYIGEIDSEDDDFDRMVMGRAGARIVPEPIRNMQGKKRSSKKALKWLGLA